MKFASESLRQERRFGPETACSRGSADLGFLDPRVSNRVITGPLRAWIRPCICKKQGLLSGRTGRGQWLAEAKRAPLRIPAGGYVALAKGLKIQTGRLSAVHDGLLNIRG